MTISNTLKILIAIVTICNALIVPLAIKSVKDCIKEVSDEDVIDNIFKDAIETGSLIRKADINMAKKIVMQIPAEHSRKTAMEFLLDIKYMSPTSEDYRHDLSVNVAAIKSEMRFAAMYKA